MAVCSLSTDTALLANGLQPCAVLVHGETCEAELKSLSAEQQLVLQVGQEERTLPLGDLVSWRRPHRAPLVPGLLLVDGSFLAVERAADIRGLAEQQLILVSPLWGILRWPWSQVRAVVFTSPVDRLQQTRLRDQLAATRGTSDQLWLDNGDRLEGEFVSLSDRSLYFRLDGRTVTIELDRARALVPNPSLRIAPGTNNRSVLVGLTDGSQLRARELEIHERYLRLSCAGGIQLQSNPLARPDAVQNVVLLQPLGGRVVYLSDLEPLDYLHLPYLSVPWSYARDRNVVGGCLSAAQTPHAKGLGMHSTSRLAYRLDDTFARFAAQLAVDDSAGQGGSVVFRVFVDRGSGWNSAYESPVVRGGDAPRTCSVDLLGASRMALVVDYADRADELDHADWLDARLIPAE